MQLLSPAYLWLSALAVMPVLLYLFRRKSKRIDVSTLVFFKSLAQEHQESAWLRRLKKLLSFLLTLAILLGVVLALARLVFSPRSEETRTVVILLDRSASMAVADEGGVSRLDEARRELRSRLDALPEDVGVALVAYDRRPVVVQPRTMNRRELIAHLDKIAVRPVPQDPTAAVDSALTLARLETPAVVWHASDAGFDVRAGIDRGVSDGVSDGEGVGGLGADSGGGPGGGVRLVVDVPDGVEWEFLDHALPTPSNVGFTAFQVRRVPMAHSRFEVFVRVALNRAAPEAVVARLEVGISGLVPLQLRDIDLEPGQSEELVIPVEGVEDQLLHLALRAEGDVLASDNDILVPLPRSRPVVAAVIAPQPDPDAPPRIDPFTEIALMAIQEQGELVVWKGTPASWPPRDPVDVAIFDNWLPDEWPTELPVIAIDSPGDSGPIRVRRLAGGGVPYDSVRVSDENHPLLYRVSSNRLALTQSLLYEVDGALQPVWLAGSEPVLSAGEVRGQRVVVMGLSVARSERLPLTASFPILMGNALLWCAEKSQAVGERIREHRSGDFVQVGGQVLTWTEWRDGQARQTQVSSGGDLLELQRVGVWKTADGVVGTSCLLSNRESDVPGHADGLGEGAGAAATEALEAGGRQRGVFFRSLLLGDVTWLIVAAVLLFLLVESWLFHRHAVY